MSKIDVCAPAERRFIDDLAALLTPFGMSAAQAHVFGLVLIRPEPIALERIATLLAMSKSSASVAARVLERHGLLRRHGEPGSKRIRYGASNAPWAFLKAQAALMGDLSQLIGDRGRQVACGEALRRLELMADFYGGMQQEIDRRCALANTASHAALQAAG